MIQTFKEIAGGIAETVTSKQVAYGDSFGKSGAVMKILYPNGVPTAQLDDALTVVRILDKLFRIATDRDPFGESPYGDIAGYCLLALNRLKTARLQPEPSRCTLGSAQERLHAAESVRAE